MRSHSWYQEGPLRVEKIILESRQNGRVRLDAIERAMRTISDDPPSETTSRDLASMLGPLQVDELRFLLREAGNTLDQLSESAMRDAEMRLDRLTVGTSQSGNSTSIGETSVAQIRNKNGQGSGVVPFAAILQALVWSINLPNPVTAPSVP